MTYRIVKPPSLSLACALAACSESMTPVVDDGGAEPRTVFLPSLAVDVTPVNLTMHADVTTWFRMRSGAVIDPATANAGGANASVVTDNIRCSFRAFRDDDHDGHDDGDHDRA